MPVFWISLKPVVFTSYPLIILATQMFSVHHRGKVVVRIISLIQCLQQENSYFLYTIIGSSFYILLINMFSYNHHSINVCLLWKLIPGNTGFLLWGWGNGWSLSRKLIVQYFWWFFSPILDNWHHNGCAGS